MKHEKVSHAQPPFFSSSLTPNCEQAKDLPVENRGHGPPCCKRQ